MGLPRLSRCLDNLTFRAGRDCLGNANSEIPPVPKSPPSQQDCSYQLVCGGFGFLELSMIPYLWVLPDASTPSSVTALVGIARRVVSTDMVLLSFEQRFAGSIRSRLSPRNPLLDWVQLTFTSMFLLPFPNVVRLTHIIDLARFLVNVTVYSRFGW